MVNIRYRNEGKEMGMIKNKKDLKVYLEADKKALGRVRNKPKMNDLIWRYQIILRKCEYYNNYSKNIISRMGFYYYKVRLFWLGTKCNFEIPLNVCDKGLSIAHIGPIIINGNAKIGENCRIHVGVNIGTQAGYSDLAPIIGENVYIGPGAKIFGKIKIADRVAIGANAVVNKDVLESGISIGGVPAKKIGNKGAVAIGTSN